VLWEREINAEGGKMYFRANLTIFAALIFTAAFIASFETVSACALVSETVYDSCVEVLAYCKFGNEFTGYYFAWNFGGCVMGFLLGSSFYTYSEDEDGFCNCEQTGERWEPSPRYNGQECKRVAGASCNMFVKEGNWDASEGKCVVCSDKKENEYFNCNGISYQGNNKCESACGASNQCDEQSPNSYLLDYCTYNYLEVNRYCNSNCQYSSIKYYCNADNCGKSQSCEDETYYCVYDNGWKWSTSKPENFCCSDADCPPKDNIKGKCVNYRCEWPRCVRDEGCVSGTRCYCGVCSSTHTSAGCPSGQCCDRDYGGTEPGSCVGKGTIRNIGGKSYLCDPPFENLESIDSEKNSSYITKLKALYSSVVNFLSHFFTQR